MSLILMTTLFYKALILQGEIWRWSLLGPKGLRMALFWGGGGGEGAYANINMVA